MQGFHKTDSKTEFIYAAGFFVILLGFVIVMTYIGFSAAPDNFIIGSELNGDGTVEYLCLGSHCDHINQMDW